MAIKKNPIFKGLLDETIILIFFAFLIFLFLGLSIFGWEKVQEMIIGYGLGLTAVILVGAILVLIAILTGFIKNKRGGRLF